MLFRCRHHWLAAVSVVCCLLLPPLTQFNFVSDMNRVLLAAQRSGRARIVCSALPPPFFDTSGRLQRGGTPPKEHTRLYAPVHKGNSLVSEDPLGNFRPLLLTQEEADPYTSQEGCIEVWLGGASEGALANLHEGEHGSRPDVGFWLLELSHLEAPPSASELGLPGNAQWAPLRDRAGPSICDRLVDDDYAALLATARGLAAWHRSIPFCAKCGGRTVSYRAGRNRKCENCGARYRPRLDPSVIVLVVKGRKCLLGRKDSWPKGRYSTLAGFVEFGESFEECLVREVFEESGVKVARDSIRSVASQPWLFPRSLMAGYIAEAEDESLLVDHDELEDAAWFDAEQVRSSLAKGSAGEEDGTFHVPSRVSLARRIIETWLVELES